MHDAGASAALSDKLLILLTAADVSPQRLEQLLEESAHRLFAELAGAGGSATAMRSLEAGADPYRYSAGATPAFDATVELRPGAAGLDGAAECLQGLGTVWGESICADRSTVLVGQMRSFLAPGPTPLRYQYLMRRRSDFSPQQYRSYYAEQHSRFGLRTGGIVDYVQFYVDRNRSAALSRATGFAAPDVDSVSELHVAIMENFLAATADGRLGAEATEDEERFVDRARSVMFFSTELFRFADQAGQTAAGHTTGE